VPQLERGGGGGGSSILQTSTNSKKKCFSGVRIEAPPLHGHPDCHIFDVLMRDTVRTSVDGRGGVFQTMMLDREGGVQKFIILNQINTFKKKLSHLIKY